jgi:putative flippase GtrA
MDKLKKLFEKLVNRETISYIIVGVLTTAVNWAVYSVCYNQLHIPNLVSTWIAWFLSVAFAFVPNRKLVFNSKNKGAAAVLREVLAFFGSRIFTQLIDTLGM